MIPALLLVFAMTLAAPAQAAGTANCLKELQALRHTEGAPGKGTVDSLAGGGAIRQDLRTLYQAARVLAARGDEEGCHILVSRMRDISTENQSQESRQPPAAGNRSSQAAPTHPGVTAALPMQRLEGLVRAQSLIGAEVRNRRDVLLGEVTDVVIDPREAAVSYVLLGRGGFLSLGEKVVAIPFHKLEATADRNLYVLDVPEDRVTNAPTIDPEDINQLSTSQQQIEAYWD
jgi:sporulation protein YlmC with PRC-barrel domain